MTKYNRLIKIGKTLSWILRHTATDFGLDITDDGYILLNDILEFKQLKDVSIDDIKNVVNNNDKQRFSLKEIDGCLYIRAKQGHNNKMSSIIKVDKLLKIIDKPFPVCVHGTTNEAWKIIKKEGLNKMARMHIHFAIGVNNEKEVISGYRNNSEVLIYLDMEKAMNDGIIFYLSDNDVILTEGNNGILDPKYFRNVIIR